MRISVYGLGYVGAVSASCLARDGHTVVGVDIDPVKLDLLRRGQSPVIEAGMPELVADVVASERLRVTDDAAGALAESELSLLCVGTPSDRLGGQDLTAVKRLAMELGDALGAKDGFHTFVLRSTVVPGTTEEVLTPLLAERSGKRPGTDFGVAFQPEFLREGSSIRDYDQPPYTVVGTDDAKVQAVLRQVYGALPAPFIETSTRSAEMLKMVCNAFHALKITFANEVGRLGQTLGVDAREVMRLVCEDRQLNISPAYLRPGFAFGGSCLPKDLRALEALARQSATSLPLLQSILPSNERQVAHALQLLLDAGHRRVGMLGLSFKSGTDDLRESPLVSLAERLIGKGHDLRVFDSEVNLSRLIGANKRYITQSIPHIASLMADDAASVIAHGDAVVVGLADDAVLDAIRRHHRPDQFVLDLTGRLDPADLAATVQGVGW